MSNAPASLLSCRVNRQSALMIPLGRLSKFAPFRWFLAQVGCFSVEITEEGWKLWDAKGCHAKDSLLSALRQQLTFFLKSRPWKHWSANVPIDQTGYGGATCTSECCGLGALERTMASLSWFSGQWSHHSALWVLVVQHRVGWLVAPAVPQNRSQHSEIRAWCFAPLSLPPLWLTRSNGEHKSLII